MNKLIKATCLSLVCISWLDMSAADEWVLQGNKFKVDTLYHATVGPGTTETELRLTGTVGGQPKVHNVFYMVTELANPYVEMRAAKGGNRMRTLETVPDIAARMSKPGEKYFAGVNADFFNMSYPFNSIGACIADGFMTNELTANADIWSYYIAFDDKKVPYLSRTATLASTGNVCFPDGTNYQLRVNCYRNTDYLVLYTPQWQYYNEYTHTMHDAGYTGQNQYGAEVRVRPVDSKTLYGGNIKLEVIETPVIYKLGIKIPDDGYVLSGHGNAVNLIKSLKVGDVVIAGMGIKIDDKSMPVKELIGGFPRILTDETVLPTNNGIDHLANPEPRTAVGYNADKSKLYTLVVDGRKAGGSDGVTQVVLGDIMHHVGCTDAMNFDGGGSSTMFVDGLGVRNTPSVSSLDDRKEGEPRVVVNALFAVAVAPVDNVVASIEIREKHIDLNTGESYTPVVYGYNQYGVMVSTDLAGCSFHIPSEVATVSGQTLTATAEKGCTTLLKAEYNGAAYSIPVNVNGGGEFVAGISDVTVDENDSPAEYYMLNGVRVASPVKNAVTVTRQGSNVSKVIQR
ncbi:MAG: phosphodiester glycosidase family protein [Muribaculaceae bacterium]|nr:phosphodiester glycosidase family protein [Muribaculaceae bacterium]